MTTDDTIDEDVQKLATECLRQMKKKNCIAPAFLAALIAEARASERERLIAELKTASCDTRECVAFLENETKPENALLKEKAGNYNKKNHIKADLNKPENAKRKVKK